LQRLFRAAYVVRVDHPTVAGKWPAEALAITEAGFENIPNQAITRAMKRRVRRRYRSR
jgi:hypothetical protein